MAAAARHGGAGDIRGGRGVFAAVEAGPVRACRVGCGARETRWLTTWASGCSAAAVGVKRLAYDVGERVQCGCGARETARLRRGRAVAVRLQWARNALAYDVGERLQCGCGGRCVSRVRCDVLDKWARNVRREGNYGSGWA